MIRMRPIFGWLLLMATAGTVCAGGLGEPASPLSISQWLKGGPISLEEGKDKTVFVVVFWQTVCPHCRASLPFITEMQKKYRDQNVVFVAISAEPAETIKEFLDANGEQMDFIVAADQGSKTISLYLRAIHNTDVPHAFVIDKTGTMVWHGHPMSGLDKTIAAVLDGTYDIETGRRLEKARNLKTLYLQFVRSPGRLAQAEEIGKQTYENGKDDVLLMNDLAWKIATEPGLIKRDYDLATRAAQAAYENSGGKNPEILDTYARVLFDSGKREEAIKFQRDAVNAATTEEAKQEFQKTLEKYEKAVKEK